MYDSSDAKFRNGPNSSMVIEIRIVVTLENSDWKGTRGFQGGADVQFPNLGSIS